jgi:hypothetical protein
VASTSYDRTEFGSAFNPWFDRSRSHPIAKNDRAALWYRSAQQLLRFATLRSYQAALRP